VNLVNNGVVGNKNTLPTLLGFFCSLQAVFFQLNLIKRYGIDALSPQQLSSIMQLRDPIYSGKYLMPV